MGSEMCIRDSHVPVQERVAAERERRRKESSAGLELRNFEVGDYVLYARGRRPGVTPKLMATWTGPWRVVVAHHPARHKSEVTKNHTTPSPATGQVFVRVQ